MWPLAVPGKMCFWLLGADTWEWAVAVGLRGFTGGRKAEPNRNCSVHLLGMGVIVKKGHPRRPTIAMEMRLIYWIWRNRRMEKIYSQLTWFLGRGGL